MTDRTVKYRIGLSNIQSRCIFRNLNLMKNHQSCTKVRRHAEQKCGPWAQTIRSMLNAIHVKQKPTQTIN